VASLPLVFIYLVESGGKLDPTADEGAMASANESLSASLSSLTMYSPTGSSQYHAWSRSYVELYTIVHEWTIDNFIELDDEAAVTFKVAVDAGNGNGNENCLIKFNLSSTSLAKYYLLTSNSTSGGKLPTHSYIV
jgi:hypothetical protein